MKVSTNKKSILKENRILNLLKTKNHPVISQKRTFGQKASDSLTKSMGSWIFIILFLLFLGFWMLANTYAWISHWDLYPFILLNLVLSTLAAIQAPIILMSQNREAQKDRIRSEYDYAINRRSARNVNEILKQLDRIERKLNSKN